MSGSVLNNKIVCVVPYCEHQLLGVKKNKTIFSAPFLWNSQNFFSKTQLITNQHPNNFQMQPHAAQASWCFF
jgi:hypothetical protein